MAQPRKDPTQTRSSTSDAVSHTLFATSGYSAAHEFRFKQYSAGLTLTDQPQISRSQKSHPGREEKERETEKAQEPINPSQIPRRAMI